MQLSMQVISDASRFEDLKSMIAEIRDDPERFDRFNSEVTSPESLVVYAKNRGVMISCDESKKIFEAAERYHLNQYSNLGDEVRLDDNLLDGVNGGISWAAVGGAALGITGAILGAATAMVTAPITVPLGTAAIIGVAIASAGAGAFSGAATGAVIGGVSQAISNKL